MTLARPVISKQRCPPPPSPHSRAGTLYACLPSVSASLLYNIASFSILPLLHAPLEHLSALQFFRYFPKCSCPLFVSSKTLRLRYSFCIPNPAPGWCSRYFLAYMSQTYLVLVMPKHKPTPIFLTTSCFITTTLHETAYHPIFFFLLCYHRTMLMHLFCPLVTTSSS